MNLEEIGISLSSDMRNKINSNFTKVGQSYVEFRHRGVYNPNTTYKVNNIVSHLGSSYMCIEDNEGAIPTNKSYWGLIAIDGSKFNPRGIYDNATIYYEYDVVTYQNGIYLAKGETVGNLPSNATYWQIYLTLDVIDLLHRDYIANCTANYSYSNGLPSQLIWKDSSNNTIRTDTFAYSEDSTTETVIMTKTLPTSESIQITTVFDLEGNILSHTVI